MKFAAICLLTFLFVIANPFTALSQNKQELPEVYESSEDDDEELRIKKEIVRTIHEELNYKLKRVIEGQAPTFVLLRTFQRMAPAMEAVHADNKVELIKVAKATLKSALENEKNRMLSYENGIGRPDDAAEAKAFRLQCELRLLQLDRTEYEKLKKPRSPAALSKIKQPEMPEVYRSSENDGEELKIKKEIVRMIYWELFGKLKRLIGGQDQMAFLLGANDRLYAAREAVHGDDSQQLIKVAKDMLNRAWVVEKNRMLRYENGIGRPDDAAEARAFRLQCELRLLQLDRTEYEKLKKPRSLAALSQFKQPEIPEVYKSNEDDDEELKIKKEIVRMIYLELNYKLKRLIGGQDQVAFLLGANDRLYAAREAVHGDDSQQLIKVAKDMLKRAWVVEADRVSRHENGVGRPDDAAEAKAFRLQCELRLLQLDRTEYEKYKKPRSQLSKYVRNMIETAKSSEVFLDLGKYYISGPLITMNPGENFELRTKVLIYQKSGRKLGYIFLKAEFDGSDYQTQEFYWEFEGKRTNFSVSDQ